MQSPSAYTRTFEAAKEAHRRLHEKTTGKPLPKVSPKSKFTMEAQAKAKAKAIEDGANSKKQVAIKAGHRSFKKKKDKK